MEAAKDAHAICVMTEWDEFKNYDYQKVYDAMVKPAFIFDGRNILDHAKLRCVQGAWVDVLGGIWGIRGWRGQAGASTASAAADAH